MRKGRPFVAALMATALVAGPGPAGAEDDPSVLEAIDEAKLRVDEALRLVLDVLPDESKELLGVLGIDLRSLVPVHPAPPPEPQRATPEQTGGDPSSTAARARVADARYESAAADPHHDDHRQQLDTSHEHYEHAMGEWRSGETDVRVVLESLEAAAIAITGDRGMPIAWDIGSSLAGIARHISGRIVDAFERAGADRDTMAGLNQILYEADLEIEAGYFAAGIGKFKGILLNPLPLFSLNLFEQNIRAAFDPRSVGYSYTIAQNGQFVRSGQNGLARRATDSPATFQSATKEMQIASVSKTLTATAVLNRLHANGLTINSPIGPWLPTSWTRGSGSNNLTFRRLLTQTSGLAGNTGGSWSFNSARDAIAGGVNAPQVFTYQNVNYGLFQIMLPRLYGLGPALDVLGQLLGADAEATVTANAYRSIMQSQFFDPMGIQGACAPNDTAMTLHYNATSSASGTSFGDWSQFCSAGGWYLSTDEVTAFLAHMRYNDAILPPSMRTLMNQQFLGWMDPANYSWGDGDWGTYHNHGGDLWDGTSPPRGMGACAMSYPNGVQVSVLINSRHPNGYSTTHSSSYQCAALEAAFDNAWAISP